MGKRIYFEKGLTMEEKNELVEAVRREISKVVEGSFDLVGIRKIERLAAAARDILTYCADVPGEVNAQSDNQMIGGIITSNYASPSYIAASAGQVGPENFGAKAIRELFAIIPGVLNAQLNGPDKLTRAIADAKQAGLDDVAAMLTRKLREQLGEPEPAPTIATPLPGVPALTAIAGGES